MNVALLLAQDAQELDGLVEADIEIVLQGANAVADLAEDFDRQVGGRGHWGMK